MGTSPLRPAPGPAGASRRSSYLRLHAVDVFVRDQEKSLRFYVDQLGFDIAFDATVQTGERWLAVAPPDGGAVLALIAPKPQSRDYQHIGRPTGVVFVTENVVAKCAEWTKRGVRFQYVPRLRRVKYEHPPAAAQSAGAEEPCDATAPAPGQQNVVWGGVFTHFKDPDGNSFALVGFDEVTREIETQRRLMAEKHEAERRAAQELEIAKEVQARLFPQTLPAIRTLEYSGSCTQARQVGGDYFDFLDLGNGRFGIVVADIAGKGIAAALLMASLQSNLRIHCSTAVQEPAAMLRSVNQVFFRNTSEGAFATLFFAEYDDEARTLRYANCGHLPALLLRGDGAIERLETTASVLGLFGQWDCAVHERTMHPGDLLAVYTDGVTESFNPGDEEFGEHRLIEALQRYRHLRSPEIVAEVVREVQRFSGREQYDDITLTIAVCR